MKKIAICLFGVSYRESYLHHTNNIYQINYEKSINNYKNFLFNYLDSKNFSYDIFFSTYSTEKDDQLLEYLEPKKHTFVKDHVSNRIQSRNSHFINSLQNCLKYSKNNDINYDYVLMTRFDLKFKIPFYDVDFDFETLNLVSILEKPHFVDDNFYLFPFDKAEQLLKLSIDKKKILFHFIKKELEEIFKKINFLKNEHCFVHQLSFFKINRVLLFKKRKKRTTNRQLKQLKFNKEKELKEEQLKKEKWLKDKEFMIEQRAKQKQEAIDNRKKNIQTAIQLRKKNKNSKQSNDLNNKNKKIKHERPHHTIKNSLNNIENLHKINIDTTINK